MKIALLLTALITASANAAPAASVQAQVHEALALAQGMKTAVQQYAGKSGKFPVTNEEAGLPAATLIHGRYVASSTVAKSMIDFQFGTGSDVSLQSKHLTLIGKLHDDRTIAWSCRSDDISRKACPSECSCSG